MPPVVTKPQPQPSNGTEKPQPEPKPWTVLDRAAHELGVQANAAKARLVEIRRSIAAGEKNKVDVENLRDQARMFELFEFAYREGAKSVLALKK